MITKLVAFFALLLTGFAGCSHHISFQRPISGSGQRMVTVYAVALCGNGEHGMDMQIEVPTTDFKATIFNLCKKGDQAAVYYRCQIPVGTLGTKTKITTHARAHGIRGWGDFTEVSVDYFFYEDLSFDYLISSDGSILMPRCECTWHDSQSWVAAHPLPWPGTMEYSGPPALDGSWSDNPACVP